MPRKPFKPTLVGKASQWLGYAIYGCMSAAAKGG